MFLDLSPQTRKKSKNKQMGLNKLNKQMGHQTKKLLHSKGEHHQNKKTTCWMGKDICKPYIW